MNEWIHWIGKLTRGHKNYDPCFCSESDLLEFRRVIWKIFMSVCTQLIFYRTYSPNYTVRQQILGDCSYLILQIGILTYIEREQSILQWSQISSMLTMLCYHAFSRNVAIFRWNDTHLSARSRNYIQELNYWYRTQSRSTAYIRRRHIIISKTLLWFDYSLLFSTQ